MSFDKKIVNFRHEENSLRKISPQGGARKRRHCISPNWPMECSDGFWAITPTPNLPQSKPLYPQIHWSQLHLMAHAVPICFEHMLRVVPAKCTLLVIIIPPLKWAHSPNRKWCRHANCMTRSRSLRPTQTTKSRHAGH